MHVDFAVFNFVERVYNCEYILLHGDERGNSFSNIQGKLSAVINVRMFIYLDLNTHEIVFRVGS